VFAQNISAFDPSRVIFAYDTVTNINSNIKFRVRQFFVETYSVARRYDGATSRTTYTRGGMKTGSRDR